ncbi:probable histone-lysine N-methyltransferase set-23 [Daktulosphaira vitifoliae]|uniref:probable histone-lysine N-methyltransferase set-23 n=1 Tax=Daktulosphaira vitifoliae TaxID=58002 RepID=UPI0021AA717E|nr:probable histone-lysine N-methyltransferase set-23 [Daktulosphaira vitifoliae]
MNIYQKEDNYEHVDNSLIYSSTNVPGPGCNKEEFDSCPSHMCKCINSCLISSCDCIGISYNYDKFLSLISYDKLINECNDFCNCKLCQNRVVQLGPRIGLGISHCDKGYGLFTNNPIKKGQFICEYAGEIIDTIEAKKRAQFDNKNYIFVINEHFSNCIKTTIIDNTYIGNIGRYINHSCQPNCAVIPVRVNSFIPRLAIFSLKDIKINEEITYNYGIDNSLPITNTSKTKCLCKTDVCRGYLPSKMGLF